MHRGPGIPEVMHRKPRGVPGLDCNIHRRSGKTVGKRDKTGENSTSSYAAKLNFELDRGMGDKVGLANFRGRSAICTRSRVFTDRHTHTHTHTDMRLHIKDEG